MAALVKRKVHMPSIMSRRVLNEYEGRGVSGARLKDLYICGIPGHGWLIQNFSGALVLMADPNLDNCPFGVAVVEEIEDDVPTPAEIEAQMQVELETIIEADPLVDS